MNDDFNPLSVIALFAGVILLNLALLAGAVAVVVLVVKALV